MDNHYSTLGVAETATEDEIKKAYRKLASQHHPDKGGDTEKFKTIQTAYDTIGNANKRAEYDDMRKNPHRGGFRFSTSDMDQGGFPPGMEDILRGFGFGFNTNRPQQRRNKDVQIRVNLDLVDTLQKQTRIVKFNTTNGESQTVTVDIPKGVHSGSTVKYTGLGDNFFSTLPRGDLFVQIVVNPHPLFQIHGHDLIAPIDIDAIDAILGTKQIFKVLDGTEFELTIPAGIQGGTKFKIGNQGLYYQQQEHRGNLYLIATIKVPTTLSEAQLEIIRQVKQLNIT
jgi:DnaJ-class molecular chaperone